MKYLRSALFLLNFGAILGISHIALVISNIFFGYKGLMKVYAYYNLMITRNLGVLGNNISFINKRDYPEDRSLILIANHQSTFDIPPIIWEFRKHHVKFVAKEELRKGYPCISYTLRNNGSIFADRRRPKEALERIGELGVHISENNYAAVIFPEGRRVRNMISFRKNGLRSLLEKAPDALIVPITISGSWASELGWPMNTNHKITFEVHEPLEQNHENLDLFIELIEQKIKDKIIA